jgi:UDP-N-acetylmuramate dehydrogenase
MSIPDTFQQDRQIRDYCTFGIGGPAKFLVEVRSVDEMKHALLACNAHKLPYIILGKGSNCLFDDRGFQGTVIINKIAFIDTPSPGIYHVGAGYSFSLLGAQTARQGWSGLEFASGIPATVGGAVFMNAGANGKETCNSLSAVDFLNHKGEFQVLKKEELSCSYRTSPFQKMKGAIIGATFTLTPAPDARQKQLDIISYRTKTQPYGDKSAGCMFRNPNCGFAGALIEKSGLKGTMVGGAKVSEMHANFIVNADEATSQNVLDLVGMIKAQVKEKTGVELEAEVRYIPYTGEVS